MRGLSLIRGLGVMALLALVAGCGAKKMIFGDGDTRIIATIEAAPDLNPDVEGRPSPLVMRAYVLRSPTAFENAGFFGLYEDEAGTVGQDLIDRYQFIVEPGTTTTQEFRIDKDSGASHLGFLAAYRDLERADWRAVMEPRLGKRNRITVEAGSLSMRLVE